MKIYYIVFPKNVAVSDRPLVKNGKSSWGYATHCTYKSFNITSYPEEYEWFVKQANGEQSVLKELEL